MFHPQRRPQLHIVNADFSSRPPGRAVRLGILSGLNVPGRPMNNRSLSNLMNLAGFGSILASIVIWAISGGQDNKAEAKAHGERFGIFVGLWAPTFFILANRLELAAQDNEG